MKAPLFLSGREPLAFMSNSQGSDLNDLGIAGSIRAIAGQSDDIDDVRRLVRTAYHPWIKADQARLQE